MQTSFKRPVSVLIVVYTRNGEVLLMHRKQPADYWQSVTGSLEWEETSLQAAQRELLEETGLSKAVNLVDCQIQHQFPILPEWRSRYAPDVLTNTEHVFKLELPAVCEIFLNQYEHTEYSWLPVEQAVERASSITNRDAITQTVIHH
jgi:dATP pyrophosphohydrolase